MSENYTLLLSEVMAMKASHGAFHPITIVVPSNGASLDVTRYLARNQPDQAGLINVKATTLKSLAQSLFESSGHARGRTEVTPLLREAAVRETLDTTPGIFGVLATRKATVNAIAQTSSQLDGLTISAAQRSFNSALVMDVLQRHDQVRNELARRAYFPDEMFQTAGSELSIDWVKAELGKVIFFEIGRPRDLLQQHFMDTLFVYKSPLVIDSVPVNAENSSNIVRDAELISMTDADEEARGIARIVAEELAQGTPGNKIGIFMPSDIPYRALLDRHLSAAQIEWAGKATRQLRDTSVARSLVQLLKADTTQLDYRLVLDAMAEGAIRHPDKKFPSPSEAERIYRHLQSDDSDEEGLTEAQEKARIRRLLFKEYVHQLGEELTDAINSQTWLTAANALQRIVNKHFTPASFQKLSFGNDDFESPAVWRQELDLAIAAVGNIDGIAPSPEPRTIVEQLEAAIHSRYLRHGKQGAGVLLSNLSSGASRDLDVVIVCGLAEGIAPPRVFENPLFTDDAITHLGSAIPTSHERTLGLYENFVLTLRSGSRRKIMTFPRGNLRGGDTRVLSRWVSSHYSPDDAPKINEVGSFQDGVLTGSPTKTHIATTQQARDIARFRVNPASFFELSEDAELSAAVEMRYDRFAGYFSRFNGNVSDVAHKINILESGRKLSPTALEKYRNTPLSFFLQHVLGARPLNDVVESKELDNLTRGILIHVALERWIKGWINHSHDGSVESLLAEAEIVCSEFNADVGAHWVEQFWLVAKNDILEDLRVWHEVNQEQMDSGWQPREAEANFGKGDGDDKLPAVVVQLSDGSGSLEFVGQIDRLDQMPGGNVHVIDYKGSKSKKYDKISQENITADGTMYQLAIYAKLAEAALAHDEITGSVQASYWFVRRHVAPALLTVYMNEKATQDLADHLTVLAHDIRAGVFPPIPDDGKFDTFTNLMGAASMQRIWDYVRVREALTHITSFWDEMPGGGEDE
jgi:ATP-dependent helicase/nuclease subunit B